MERTKRAKKVQKEKLWKLFHDMRTPLAVMRINLDLIRMSEEYKKTKPKIKKLIKSLSNQVDILVEQISSKEKGK